MNKRKPDGAFGDFHEPLHHNDSPLHHNDSLQEELKQWEQASDEDFARMESEEQLTARIAALEAELAGVKELLGEARDHVAIAVATAKFQLQLEGSQFHKEKIRAALDDAQDRLARIDAALKPQEPPHDLG